MRIKKIVVMTMAAILAVIMTACNNNPTWVARHGETEVPPGAYIAYLMMGLDEASTKVEDSSKLLSGEIDGKAVSDYIVDFAKAEVNKLFGIQSKFAEVGLSLTEENITEHTSFADELYNARKSYYEAVGISKESLKMITETSMKSALLFNHFYGVGGEFALTDQEFDNVLNTNYYRASYHVFPKIDFTTGQALGQETLDQNKAKADQFLARAKAGENFVDLMWEHRSQQEGETETVTREEDYNYQYLIAKSATTSYPPVFLEGLGAAAEGDIFSLEDDYYYYVVQKLVPADATQAQKDQYRLGVTREAKYDEYTKMTGDWAQALEIVYNDQAFKAYTPKRVKEAGDKYFKAQSVSSSSLSLPPLQVSSQNEESSDTTSSSSTAE